jgi:hypothetical protein
MKLILSMTKQTFFDIESAARSSSGAEFGSELRLFKGEGQSGYLEAILSTAADLPSG